MEEPRESKVQTRGMRERPRRASASPEIRFLNPATKLANTSVKTHACTRTHVHTGSHICIHIHKK